MNAANSPERWILKVLNGNHSGAEVLLEPSEYSFGSGPDDDIHIIDVSLLPGHLRIRLTPGKIDIQAHTGSFRTLSGLLADSDLSTWHDIQPLDVIIAGTTRFALGLPNAKWNSVSLDDPAFDVSSVERAEAGASKAATILDTLSRLQPVAMPMTVLLILCVMGLWASMSNVSRSLLGHGAANDLTVVRSALDSFDFGRQIDIRQEVDGQIFATGYVATTVERRAIIDAVEKTAIPVRVRLNVLEALRIDLANLIAADHLGLTFTIDPSGVAVLDGTILDQEAAELAVQRVKESIVGLARVDSRIRTAQSLLRDITQLARTSQIEQAVIFTLNGNVIEINGILSQAKVDAWVGFLQAFAGRYAKDVSLRSYVQLQHDSGTPRVARTGTAAGQPIVFGSHPEPGAAATIDSERLRRGDFGIDDVFVMPTEQPDGTKDAPLKHSAGQPENRNRTATAPALPGAAPGQDAEQLPAAADAEPASPLVAALRARLRQAMPAIADAGVPDTARINPRGSPPPPISERSVVALDELSQISQDVLDAWARPSSSERLNDVSESLPSRQAPYRKLMDALDRLAAANRQIPVDRGPITPRDRQLFVKEYRDLFARITLPASLAPDQCRPNSRLTPQTSATVLFWLDILSTTDAVRLSEFKPEEQVRILEGALDPGLVKACLLRDQSARDPSTISVYLRVSGHNRSFADFVTRGLPRFDLPVTGASIAGARYIQTQDGRTYGEGAALDPSSRIDVIGELGMAVERSDGLHRLLYSPDITWISSR